MRAQMQRRRYVSRHGVVMVPTRGLVLAVAVLTSLVGGLTVGFGIVILASGQILGQAGALDVPVFLTGVLVTLALVWRVYLLAEARGHW